MTKQAWLVVVKYERIQTFLFDVPELKAMIGSNALLGEVLRGKLVKNGNEFDFEKHIGVNPHADRQEIDNLPALAVDCGAEFPDSGLLDELDLQGPIDDDPLTGDHDTPSAAYGHGILIRDAGSLHAVFPERAQAEKFLTKARHLVKAHLPGLKFAVEWFLLEKLNEQWKQQETLHRQETSSFQGETLPDGPQLQICQARGQRPANDKEPQDDSHRYISFEALRKRNKGTQFDGTGTADILGLMRGDLLGRLQRDITVPLKYSTEIKEIAPSGYLAVIVADGNGMGERSRNAKGTSGDYFRDDAKGEQFFHKMRIIVRQALRDALVAQFRPCLETKAREPNQSSISIPFRLMMLGGDDLLMACDAPHAFPFLVKYVTELSKHDLTDGNPLEIGAGVAIVKNVFPFHRAHELAEELAKSAKRLARADSSAGSTIDWLSCTESWHGNLVEVRRRDALRHFNLGDRRETLVLTGKPYPILQRTESHSLESLLNAAMELSTGNGQSARDDQHSLARTQLKGLAEVLPLGKRQADQAVRQMPTHVSQRLIDTNIFTGMPITLSQNKEITFPSPWERIGESHLTRLVDFLELFELCRRAKDTDVRTTTANSPANMVTH